MNGELMKLVESTNKNLRSNDLNRLLNQSQRLRAQKGDDLGRARQLKDAIQQMMYKLIDISDSMMTDEPDELRDEIERLSYELNDQQELVFALQKASDPSDGEPDEPNY